MHQPTTNKMSFGSVKLRWDNLAADENRSEALQFQFDHQGEDILFNSFRSQIWISVLASGMAWQRPWLAAKWTVSEIPEGDISGNGAALGIALIATASGTTYPQQTVVLGRLNPDGSLGPVTHMAARVEAAAAAGMKRIILPASQHFEVTEKEGVLSISALAERRGLECVFVEDLIGATEIVLQKKLPPASDGHLFPRYSARLFGILDTKVRAESASLKAQSGSWPRTETQLGALPPSEQKLWQGVFRNYDTGIEAHHAGQLYAARHLLRQSQAHLRGLAGLKDAGDSFDPALFDLRANALRKKMVDRLHLPQIDKNELQSALVLAEENDWVSGLNAKVQGAQMAVRQAYDPRSDTTPLQLSLARALLISAVKGGEYQMEDKSFYTECYQLIASREKVSVYNRASLLWPQLLPARLGKAEFFIQELKSRSNELGASLLFDVRLSSFMMELRDSKKVWEQERRNIARLAEKAQPTVQKVGFVPGRGYETPTPPVPPLPAVGLSDAARCLSWVNSYCEVAVLELKYLQLDGSFDQDSLEWKVRNRVALENLFDFADQGARRGIAFAEKVGADSSILNMIYELGSNFRASEDNEVRLEGLRQYWRCALLGAMSWQLSYSPRATAYDLEDDPPLTSVEPPPLQP